MNPTVHERTQFNNDSGSHICRLHSASRHDLAVEDKEYARNPSEVEQSSFVLNKGNFIDFKRLHQHDTTT